MDVKKPNSIRFNNRNIRKKRKFKLTSIFYVCMVMSVIITIIYLGLNFYNTNVSKYVDNAIHGIKKHLVQNGFVAKNLIVDGREHTSKKELLKMLDIPKQKLIFSLDLNEIAQKIQEMPWIRSVRMERKLPNTIFIKIVEKKPIAFWQKNKKTYLIDSLGKIIGDFRLTEFPGYLVVTGRKAPAQIPNLIKKLRKYSDVYAKITGAMYISERRWDIILDNKLCIKLPEQGIKEALQEINQLYKNNKLFSLNFHTIDLRTKGRIYFYLSKKGRRVVKNETGRFV